MVGDSANRIRDWHFKEKSFRDFLNKIGLKTGENNNPDSSRKYKINATEDEYVSLRQEWRERNGK